jgi:hypothetical protein
MELAELCEKLTRAIHLDATKKAIVILWWANNRSPNTPLTAYYLAQTISRHRIGNPNRTVLSKGLAASPLTLKSRSGFVLKAGAGETVSSWIADIMDSSMPSVDQSAGYLPEAVWINTRGYIEKVCSQLNGCYHYGFYDGAAVMVRRLIETLIIETFEHLNRSGEIKDSNGHYFMLGELVGIVVGTKGLDLGRETKAALNEIKKLGDRSAHNRRFNAVKADLDLLRSGCRVSSEELINMAEIRRKRGDNGNI